MADTVLSISPRIREGRPCRGARDTYTSPCAPSPTYITRTCCRSFTVLRFRHFHQFCRGFTTDLREYDREDLAALQIIHARVPARRLLLISRTPAVSRTQSPDSAISTIFAVSNRVLPGETIPRGVAHMACLPCEVSVSHVPPSASPPPISHSAVSIHSTLRPSPVL